MAEEDEFDLRGYKAKQWEEVIGNALIYAEKAGTLYEQGKAQEAEVYVEEILKPLENHRGLIRAIDWASTALSALGIGGSVTEALSHLNNVTNASELTELMEEKQSEIQMAQVQAQQRPSAPLIEDVQTHSAPPATGQQPRTRGAGPVVG